MKKRNIMILVVLLIIGFASVSTTLILNGTIGIASSEDDFDVIFTSAKINGEGASATIDETKKKITFTSSKLTSVGEKAILEYKIKNNSTQYDADVTINCTSDASEYISVINELEDEEIGEGYKTTFRAQEIKSGVITSELIKSYTGEDASVEVTCTIVANATEREEIVEDICIPETYEKGVWKYTDNDCSGNLTKGDLITIDTESFYVYDIEGDKVKAIAQYNLYVGGQTNDSCNVIPLENPTGLQSPLARGRILDEEGNEAFPFVGVVPFTTYEKYNSVTSAMTENIPKQNDYSISTIKEYVDEYAQKLEKLDANINTVRLITKEELETAGCDSEKYSCKAGYDYNNGKEDATFEGAPEYLYSTSYWTSSPHAEYDDFVWYVYSYGYFVDYDVRYGYVLGVRPVIELSKSLFQ